MTALMDEKDTYLSVFARFEAARAGDPPALVKLRRNAIERFAALGFPTLEDEDWRFTPLTALTRESFEVGVYDRATRDDKSADFIRLVMRAGYHGGLPHGARLFLPESGLPEGVIICTLAEALAKHPDLVEPHLARYADFEEHAFAALNTAFLQDGAFVYLPKNCALDRPIELVFLSESPKGRQIAWNRRCLIVAEQHSQASVIERYMGVPPIYFTNAVTELALGEGAVIDHYKVQQERKESFHVATTQVQLGRSCNFSSHNLAFGGRLTRNDINAVLDGEGSECTLNGLYLGNGEQLIDNHTRIDHAKPHCASHELYKGILDGKSRGVFAGRIYVHQDAQKTDAKQTNQTLLLSDDAIIDTKPQLEIFADDVKCTHGATVGQLDAESIFYLRTRGIGKDEARALLTFAFANDIVGRIKIEPLRAELEKLLFAAHRSPHAPREAAPHAEREGYDKEAP